MAIFGPKTWVNPLQKCQFFDFLNASFLQPRKAFFVLEYRKRNFPGLYCLKKILGKMPIFGPTPWVNPFRKVSIFPLFELLVFIAQKGIFFVLEYRKRHFPGLYCLKKKVGKMALFGPKPWVNPFRKMSIFRLFELLVFIAQKGFFSFHNIVKVIFLPCIAQKKEVGKMTIFAPKAWCQKHGVNFSTF